MCPVGFNVSSAILSEPNMFKVKVCKYKTLIYSWSYVTYRILTDCGPSVFV